MENLAVTCAVGIALSISSCTSFNRISTFDQKATFESNVKLLESKLSKTDQDANNKMGLVSPEKTVTLFSHNKVGFDSRVSYTGACTATVDFSVNSSPSVIFEPGQYIVDRNSKMGLTIVAWLSTQVGHISDMISAAENKCGSKFYLAARYVGSADGIPVHPGNVKYNGEFGDITIPDKYATLNNEPTSFDIWQNKDLSNQELAAVRAAGLAAMVTELSQPMKVDASYQIETSLKVGPDFRFARVYLQIGENGNDDKYALMVQ